MSETDDLKKLILNQTLFVPIAREELANAILIELNKIFPPLEVQPFYFYVPSWKDNITENWIEFTLNLEYCYILSNLSLQNRTLEAYEKLKQEYNKDIEKIVKKAPSIVSDAYPYRLHIDILESNESGCEIEIDCYPFLYYKVTYFRINVDDLQKQNALISCKRILQTLVIGLNGTPKDKAKTESDLVTFSSFLGINQNWMSATCALQLQEVAVILVAQKKSIDLKKESVQRILHKSQISDFSFNNQYEAFTKEVKRLYDIEMPFMPIALRKMRVEVLHKGYIPKGADCFIHNRLA